MSSSTPEEKENPIVTLRAQAEKFDYSKLRAGKDNAEANSGNTAFCDLRRMDFVINKKSTSRDFIAKLYKEHDSLLPKSEGKNEDYRPFARKVFKEMFEHAGAKVPSDPILEELVINCNQAGYVGALYDEDKPLFHVMKTHELVFSSSHTTHINCSDPSHATIRIEEKIAVCTLAKPEEELCKLDSSLELTLKSQDDKNVTYENGRLSLTIPDRLKNYSVDDKSLFGIIKECFQKFCERLGFFKIKIEHDLGNPLEVSDHLENMEPPIHSNEHGLN
ncbi:hypothetical protein [Wolbachia endosymbiont (group A) of Bibio marci]|uniref:hypothetical protein n=1 Tax=Wolbachia endosymbiont (group A) of Bibio marci TaxID=2953987 RepID=UPI00223282A9|nr:hypothetical protein [Wolbachia endosymbiont (group A) of Bibio marci]